MEEMGKLIGRGAETGALDGVLAAARDGMSGVLVLRGEAGIGKTALLDWAAGAADGMRVTRVAAVESEMDLGFAGLHQLLLPFLDGVDLLPAPQRAALQSALGLAAGPPPDRFMVGLAALTLLTDAAASRPVLCLVDNAEWLDEASGGVLGFVARRLLADQVGMLFAVQEEEEEERAVLEGLPVLLVSGLADEPARELLSAAAGGPVDPRVSERIVAETAGNPLGLVEFGGELTTGERSGAVPLTAALRFGGRLEKLYLSRVRALPADAQTLLLVLAADQLGDPGKVWQAAGRLGIGPEAVELSAVERLLTGAPSLRFRHPLMRSIVYHGAPSVARWRVHEALAAVSDPVRDPDRRAWHLAQAASGPDEQVAGELERSAGRARGRGGWTSSAAFLERSAELTQDPARRARRLVAAAEARLVAGETPAARALLGRAAPDVPDPVVRARARRLEGNILFAAGEPAATSVLLEAARIAMPHDVRSARDTLLEAFAAQLSSRRAAETAEVIEAIRSAPAATGSQATLGDLLLDGLAALAERRFPAAARLLRQAVAAAMAGQPAPCEAPHGFLAFRLGAAELYDDSAWRDLADQWVASARDRGAVTATVVGLGFQVFSQVTDGRFAAAEATISEARSLAEAMGNRTYLEGLANLELDVFAWRGDQARARRLADRLLGTTVGQGPGHRSQRVHKALAALEIGLGNYEDALHHALAAATARPVLVYRSSPELLIEAAVRCGDRASASAAFEAVAPWWQACGTPWSLGLLARGQALLADDGAAEDMYRLSIEHLRRGAITPELARSHLLYGEWLRRQRRRRGAREQLRTACELFGALGMDAFADRARAELRAAGEHAAARPTGTPDTLTPQEARIAWMAAEGATNQAIAARLFVSASTVDYHLRKVFRKLGVTSRAQLHHALSAGDDGGQ
jgi:DNA-binding CsgD family transcriptional regulator